MDIVDDGELLDDVKSINVIDELTDSWTKRTDIDDIEYSPFQHPGRATFYETSKPVYNLDARKNVAFAPPKHAAVFELDAAGNLRVTQRSGDDYLSNLLDRTHNDSPAQRHPWYPSNTVDWKQYYFDRGTIRFDDLPQEGRNTSALIDSNGPFPYGQDNTRFKNKESLLPPQTNSNYYKEYTVTTPGLSHRGKRRIVTGNNGAIKYYTEDHYKWFRRILP
ncbi:MAG: hypothetical protein GY797_37665 [Deltaproteobacteria bacterium]|nr:hypothetical protein [Deltaproteobacteria bacterium]